MNVIGSAVAPAYLWSCDRLGLRARALGRPTIVNHGRIEIGDDLNVDCRGARIELGTAPGARIAIGSSVSIGPGTVIEAVRFVEIGDRVTIGARCRIADSAPDAAEPSPIWIGDGVTLEDGVTLLPGATIAAGSTVVAGSVVAGGLHPRAAGWGVPARPFGAAPEPGGRGAAAGTSPPRAGASVAHPVP
jgi:acetyltransferase-like isoleucine patch superfamily enzyme